MCVQFPNAKYANAVKRTVLLSTASSTSPGADVQRTPRFGGESKRFDLAKRSPASRFSPEEFAFGARGWMENPREMNKSCAYHKTKRQFDREERGLAPFHIHLSEITLLDLSVCHALSSLLYLVDSGLMEWDVLCAPMTMGVKKPGAF